MSTFNEAARTSIGLATLWPVADANTAQLMQSFYRLREEQKLTKAEALR